MLYLAAKNKTFLFFYFFFNSGILDFDFKCTGISFEVKLITDKTSYACCEFLRHHIMKDTAMMIMLLKRLHFDKVSAQHTKYKASQRAHDVKRRSDVMTSHRR